MAAVWLWCVVRAVLVEKMKFNAPRREGNNANKRPGVGGLGNRELPASRLLLSLAFVRSTCSSSLFARLLAMAVFDFPAEELL